MYDLLDVSNVYPKVSSDSLTYIIIIPIIYRVINLFYNNNKGIKNKNMNIVVLFFSYYFIKSIL